MKYPYEELLAELDGITNDILDPLVQQRVSLKVKQFGRRICEGMSPIEQDAFDCIIKINKNNDGFDILPANLFTAAILYGRYIPYFLIKDSRADWKFADGHYLTYEQDIGKWMLYDKCQIQEKEKQQYDKWEEERKKKMDEWEEKNPGVPLDSLEIQMGNEYKGSMDGSFEIRTINGKIWLIPKGSYSFDE